MPSLRELFNIISYFDMTPAEFFAPLEDANTPYRELCEKLRTMKMSEPVQVYTACQFVSPQIFPAFSKAVHKNFGKNILMRYKRMNII